MLLGIELNEPFLSWQLNCNSKCKSRILEDLMVGKHYVTTFQPLGDAMEDFSDTKNSWFECLNKTSIPTIYLPSSLDGA
jgi:hypothetical protein